MSLPKTNTCTTLMSPLRVEIRLEQFRLLTEKKSVLLWEYRGMIMILTAIWCLWRGRTKTKSTVCQGVFVLSSDILSWKMHPRFQVRFRRLCYGSGIFRHPCLAPTVQAARAATPTSARVSLISQHPPCSQLHTAHTPRCIPDDGLCIDES